MEKQLRLQAKGNIVYRIRTTLLLTGILLIGLLVAGCSAATTRATDTLPEMTGATATSDTPDAGTTGDSQSEAAVAEAESAPAADDGDDADEIVRPDGWGEETHSNDADPNYAVVFPDDEVNTITFTLAPEEWQAMLDDMTATYGEPGSRSGQGVGDPGAAGPADGGQRPAAPPAGGQAGPGGDGAGARPAGQGRGGGVPGDFTTENPIWVPADIEFEGDLWTDVGVRFKGNSSLMNAWSSGSLQLPFKLDFDEFEDDYPAIDNQRFYGFKQLSLSNNYNDATFMRDAVTSDIMADAGITAAETAFYEVYVDYGEGPVNFGLYTMIEVVDDTVIERVFGDDDGNIYEGDGPAVSLAEGTYDGISSSFQKENNEDDADWSDIETLYSLLHSDTRLSDPAAWKAELETVFDVDTFLHWLAINTVIENWDTYGAATHNFYLYNNPETGQLTWIPWDHNEALKEGRRSNMTLAMDRIGDEWPLISFLLADENYYDAYVGYVDETINTVFQVDDMTAKYQEIAALIEPYATAKVGAETFVQGVQELIDHTVARVAAAEAFVAQMAQ